MKRRIAIAFPFLGWFTAIDAPKLVPKVACGSLTFKLFSKSCRVPIRIGYQRYRCRRAVTPSEFGNSCIDTLSGLKTLEAQLYSCQITPSSGVITGHDRNNLKGKSNPLIQHKTTRIAPSSFQPQMDLFEPCFPLQLRVFITILVKNVALPFNHWSDSPLAPQNAMYCGKGCCTSSD